MKKLLLLIFMIVVALPLMAQDDMMMEDSTVMEEVVMDSMATVVDTVAAELTDVAEEAVAAAEEMVEAPKAEGMKGIFVAPQFNYILFKPLNSGGSGMSYGISVGTPVMFDLFGMNAHVVVDLGMVSEGTDAAVEGFVAMAGFLTKVAKLPFGCVVVDSKLGWAGEGFGANLSANIVYPVAGMPLKIVAKVGAGGGLMADDAGAFNHVFFGLAANYSLDDLLNK